MNPEFLREGNAVHDFMHPDRIVMGGIDDRTLDTLAKVYSAFDTDCLRTTPKTAEMIKYAANSLLATMISFSNEIANLCTALGGIDVVDVMKGVHLDKRLSPIVTDEDGNRVQRITPAFTTYLEAGCGFGGSCFPKDVQALIAHGKQAGSPMRLLDAVIQINKEQPHQCIDLLRRHFDSLEGVQTTVLGLAFKPGTDDIRESPAIPVIKELLDQHARVKTYDPIANGEARMAIGDAGVEFCTDIDQALDGAEAVILITRWSEFEHLPELLAQADPQPVLVDGRRMLDKQSVARYEGIGL
jgi:UDPglucose 6-dehydrogenase/GDP-mannose 6-dehydrogenase